MHAQIERVMPARWLWRRRIRRWHVGYPDPELRFLARFCRGHICVDVGASLGIYTMHMLGHAREVWAFEPRVEQAARLRSTLGRDSRVHIEALALSDRTGTARFRLCTDDLGRSTLEPMNVLEGLAVEEIQVPVRTLDSYDLRGVGCIKIDVEGHEEWTLRGAAQTLESSHPALFVELDERHNPGITERVPRWLSGFGYRQCSVRNGRLIETDDVPPQERGCNAVFLLQRHMNVR